MVIDIGDKGRRVDPVRYMGRAVKEAKQSQVREALANGEKIKLVSLPGGVEIVGMRDVDGGMVPILNIDQGTQGMDEVVDKVDLSELERNRINFLEEELKIPPWTACLEALGREITDENKWRAEMEEIYGRPPNEANIPAVVSITGMPEQYKSFWMTYMAINGQAVIGLDPSSNDTLPNYLAQTLTTTTIEEMVEAVIHDVNPNTREGSENWMVDMGDGVQHLVKKQKYLWPGMTESPDGLVTANVSEDTVSLDTGVDINRNFKLDESKALRSKALSEFRRVMSGGQRPEVIFADMAGYWVRQGNVYDLAAMESMTCLIPSRVEASWGNEWMVRDDTMNVRVLYDYNNFWEGNKQRILALDKYRNDLIMAAINNDSRQTDLAREAVDQLAENIHQPLPPVVQERFVDSYKKAMQRVVNGTPDKLDSGLIPIDVKSVFNENQKLMAEVLARGGVGEAIGVGAKNEDLGTEMIQMLENGCVVIPRMTERGFVCIDRDGVFVIQTEENSLVENELNRIGSQTNKFIVENITLRENQSWRNQEYWKDRKVTILPVEIEKQAKVVEEAQKLASERPFYSSTDYYIWERKGQQGTVRIFSDALATEKSVIQ